MGRADVRDFIEEGAKIAAVDKVNGGARYARMSTRRM
jgi:hypothetical protein